MWTCTSQLLADGRVRRFVPLRGGSTIRYGNVLRYLQDDLDFRSFFLSILSGAGFPAYRWETPPITRQTADRDFEFVLLDEPGLDRFPDERAFAEQFRAATAGRLVITFPNLGNDALLVVPRPSPSADGYAHLAAFVRAAPVEQQQELWRAVGAAMEARIGIQPIWLSTAGMGVPWLHVRLDSRPKYYAFGPYRDDR